MYFSYIVKRISLFTIHCISKMNFLEAEMDVTERRQTEAVVAAAADCVEQTKLQVVVARRLQHCRIVWSIFWQPLLKSFQSVFVSSQIPCLHRLKFLLPVFLLPSSHGIA